MVMSASLSVQDPPHGPHAALKTPGLEHATRNRRKPAPAIGYARSSLPSHGVGGTSEMRTTISAALFGAPLDPFSSQTRQHIVLVAFLAWIGLGADGLSSACYGPEEAFLALGEHTHLALYMAAATALTVFVIAVGYNQVIELFPSGGGGYKVATNLIGPYTGLVSGAALIVDYMLTIAISVASGADAVFSLLPVAAQSLKLWTELGLVLLLLYLNLRGMRESIKVLLPIFLGFSSLTWC